MASEETKAVQVSHTPGPLKVVDGDNGLDGIGRVIVHHKDDLSFRQIATVFGGDEDREANAEFLVRAWNSHDEMLTALRKVPLFKHTKDGLGWQCIGCGQVSGINDDGSDRDEDCLDGCYVLIVEAAIATAEGK